jgi:hypothetical protein
VHSVLRAGEQSRAANRTLRFEGEDYGSGVSMFLVDNEPGEGPGCTGTRTRRPGSSARGA